MIKHLLFFLGLLVFGLTTASGAPTAGEVLIVADEIPAMEVVAKSLKDLEGINSTIVLQTELPASLSQYQAVIVYIHKVLNAGPEKAFIKYAQEGGKLILLHHTLGSGKKVNEQWFTFLGFDLPKKDVNEGGYKYKEDVEMKVVNLAPTHFITSNKVKYESKIPYKRESTGKEEILPGFALHDTEVYLNHTYLTPRTLLLGVVYTDETGKVWMQDRTAWCMRAGKGWLFYAQPGHTAKDFENPFYARILANAVIFQPQQY
ncbi:ThuA domain-containing protein [Spirosoma areae]